MVANYNSTQYAAGNPVPAFGEAGEVQIQYFLVNIPATAGLNDTMNIGYLPANARIHQMVLKCSDMDTGGPTLTISIGDAGSATRYFSASVAGQAGVPDRTMATAGLMFKTTAKTLLLGLIAAAATTPAAGTLELAVWYVVEASATS